MCIKKFENFNYTDSIVSDINDLLFDIKDYGWIIKTYIYKNQFKSIIEKDKSGKYKMKKDYDKKLSFMLVIESTTEYDDDKEGSIFNSECLSSIKSVIKYTEKEGYDYISYYEEDDGLFLEYTPINNINELENSYHYIGPIIVFEFYEKNIHK